MPEEDLVSGLINAVVVATGSECQSSFLAKHLLRTAELKKSCASSLSETLALGVTYLYCYVHKTTYK